jgi:hypothetical protein
LCCHALGGFTLVFEPKEIGRVATLLEFHEPIQIAAEVGVDFLRPGFARQVVDVEPARA